MSTKKKTFKFSLIFTFIFYLITASAHWFPTIASALPSACTPTTVFAPFPCPFFNATSSHQSPTVASPPIRSHRQRCLPPSPVLSLLILLAFLLLNHILQSVAHDRQLSPSGRPVNCPSLPTVALQMHTGNTASTLLLLSLSILHYLQCNLFSPATHCRPSS